MSRTEGINLPRLPTSHTRLTSPQSLNVHPGTNKPSGTAGDARTNASKLERRQHRRSVSEPSYTAYLGTPRQDIPRHVYHDAAMFDDVFEKQGKLFHSRDAPKITNPLNSLHYSSLHDPHCRKLFLNNKALRSHLMDLGLITDDLKVVASTHEQRQKIRAHELLERKETLLYKLEMQEQQRIERLQKAPKQLPLRYTDSILKAEERQEKAEMVKQMKIEKAIQAQEAKKSLAEKRRLVEKKKMQQAIEEARLYEQAKRNAARYRQETAELVAYERQYGKIGAQLALWHRESDRIHNRIVIMERQHWSKKKKHPHLSEETRSHDQPQPIRSPTDESAPILPSAEEQRETQESISPAPTHNLLAHSEQNANKDEIPEEKARAIRGESLAENSPREAATPPEQNDIATNPAGTIETPQDENAESKERMSYLQGPKEAISQPEEPPEQVQEVELLDCNQSDAQLTSIFIESLKRVDHQNLGLVSIDDFTQLLNSRDLGLQLNENEIVYIAEEADSGNGLVSYISVAQQLPNLLVAMYNQRAERQMQQYGGYTEDQWCQMYLPSGIVYYNKLTGELLIGGRPNDFRPFLKEDPFEESIVDFFETADTDKDGVVDVSNFYSLLVSPIVSARIYSNQMEDLITLFQKNSDNNLATLEIFAPIAKTLLVMIYQNAYPDVDEWIELDSRKFGTFFFNKETGETTLGPGKLGEENAQTEQAVEATGVKASPKKKKSKKKTTQEPSDSEPSEISKAEKLTSSTQDLVSDTNHENVSPDHEETANSPPVTNLQHSNEKATSANTAQSSAPELPEKTSESILPQDQCESIQPVKNRSTSEENQLRELDDETSKEDSKAETINRHQELKVLVQKVVELEIHPQPADFDSAQQLESSSDQEKGANSTSPKPSSQQETSIEGEADNTAAVPEPKASSEDLPAMKLQAETKAETDNELKIYNNSSEKEKHDIETNPTESKPIQQQQI